MATFEIKVKKIDSIEDHPNADKLEIAVIGGYRSLIQIGQFKKGDYVVYLPEAAVLPNWLIKAVGLWNEDKGIGNLSGRQGNRVKAINLRGIVSQGLLYPVETCASDELGCGYLVRGEVGGAVHLREDELLEKDFSQYLDIHKYEPEIPTNMAGEVANVFGHTIKYDVENLQNHWNTFDVDDEVVVTEKLHGTLMCVGKAESDLGHKDLLNGNVIINSKGVSANGLCFKWNDENAHNLYVMTFKEHLLDKWDDLVSYFKDIFEDTPFFILGEVFGQGVQDLHYGHKNKKGYRVFDVYLGESSNGRFLDYDELKLFCATMDIDMVPELYRGNFDFDTMTALRDGKETLSGEESNMREGIVIKTVIEERTPTLSRKQLKFISPDYLTRKNGTELN